MPRLKEVLGTGSAPIHAQAIVGTVSNLTTTGTAVGTAALISTETVFLTTAASQTGALLPTGANALPGDSCYVYNNTSTTAVVYPGGSDNANGSTSGINVAQAKLLILKRVNSTNWAYIITP